MVGEKSGMGSEEASSGGDIDSVGRERKWEKEGRWRPLKHKSKCSGAVTAVW